jgi:hypothetical protein
MAAARKETTDDTQALASALDPALPPSAVATVAEPAPQPFDVQGSLNQLLTIMQQYRDAGLIQQLPDGSFRLPGQQDALWQQRLAQGSECHCRACTPHNQRHWICMICNSIHEWVLVQDKPITMQTRLTAGGVTGYVHNVCSNACALEYRRRLGQGSGTVMVPGEDRAVPVAGGDESSFFLNG